MKTIFILVILAIFSASEQRLSFPWNKKNRDDKSSSATLGSRIINITEISKNESKGSIRVNRSDVSFSIFCVDTSHQHTYPGPYTTTFKLINLDTNEESELVKEGRLQISGVWPFHISKQAGELKVGRYLLIVTQVHDGITLERLRLEFEVVA